VLILPLHPFEAGSRFTADLAAALGERPQDGLKTCPVERLDGERHRIAHGQRRVLQKWQEFPFRVATGREQLFSDLLTPAEEAVMPAYMLDRVDIVSQLDERRPQLGLASRVVVVLISSHLRPCSRTTAPLNSSFLKTMVAVQP